MARRVALPSKIQKRLISTLMSNAKEINQDPNFTLKSNAEFASRSKNIFGGLKDIEINHETWMTKNEALENFEKSECKSTVKPDVFKKPAAIKYKKRKADVTSDFRGKKWRKYSLADIPLSSDATNTAVALQFLDDLRKAREKNYDYTETGDKILFNKPLVKKKENISHFALSNSHEKEPIKLVTPTDSISKPHSEMKPIPDIHLEHLMSDDTDQ